MYLGGLTEKISSSLGPKTTQGYVEHTGRAAREGKRERTKTLKYHAVLEKVSALEQNNQFGGAFCTTKSHMTVVKLAIVHLGPFQYCNLKQRRTPPSTQFQPYARNTAR